MSMSRMTMGELLRYANTTIDSLSSSDLEIELFKRLSEIVDNSDGLYEVTKDYDDGVLVTLISKLDEHDLMDCEELEKAINMFKAVNKVFDETEDLNKALSLFNKIKELNEDTTAIADVLTLLTLAKEIN